MSVSLLWQSVSGKSLSTMTPSHTKEAIEKAFGSLPVEIEETDLMLLEGMRAVDSKNTAWKELIDAVGKHGKIRVWGEY